MNAGPSKQQQFIALCLKVFEQGGNPYSREGEKATSDLVDFLNSANLDQLDFNTLHNGKTILCHLALDIANTRKTLPLEIILQKADLNKIDFNATIDYGALGTLSLLWLVIFNANQSSICLEALIARGDLSKMDWNKPFGEAKASCLWMLAKTGKRKLIDDFLNKKVPGIDLTSKPSSPADAKTAQELIDEIKKPAAVANPPAPAWNPPAPAWNPPAQAAMPPVAPPPPPPPPPPPFGPSLLARLTAFSMYPKSTSFVIGLTVGTLVMSHSWIFILGASCLATAASMAYFSLRNAYYQRKLNRLPRVGNIPFYERQAYLEGEKAANSMSHYLVSYLRPSCWINFSAFGAGMRDEVRDHHERHYLKKPR